MNLDQLTKKLAFKRAGPFPVVKKVGPPAYKLKMWKNLCPVINESKQTLPPPSLHTTTGILTNGYCPKSRRCHTRSQKNPELQKTGERATIPCQVAGLRNQPGKTDTKSSRGLLNHVGTSARISQTHIPRILTICIIMISWCMVTLCITFFFFLNQ